MSMATATCDHGVPFRCPCALCDAAAERLAPIVRNSQQRRVLLNEAADLIDGDRAADYGDAAENFTRIGIGWSEILGVRVEAHHVALCMDWLKTCRLITSPRHRDSWVDKAGYTALGGEVALK